MLTSGLDLTAPEIPCGRDDD